MKKMYFTLLSVAFLVGCVSDIERMEAEGQNRWRQRTAEQQAKYIGQKLETMYPEYGVPKAKARLSSGGEFIEFEHYRTGYQCNASVVTNSKGIITKLKVSGQNGCVMP